MGFSLPASLIRDWPALCAAFAQECLDRFPWWFNGQEADLGLADIRLIPEVKMMGEECCLCDQNIGGQPAIKATFRRRFDIPPGQTNEDGWNKIDELFFLAHPVCCQKLLTDSTRA